MSSLSRALAAVARFFRGRSRLGRVALLLIAAATVLLSLRTERRVEHEAAFCTSSCHVNAHTGSRALAPGHAGVECRQCHEMSSGTAAKLWWQSVVHKKSPVVHGEAKSATCVECHERRPAEWRLVAATQGHREHHDAKGVDCVSCHAQESAPPEKVCTSCHASEHLHKTTTMGAETCLSCHNFDASPKRLKPPSTVACEKCHADPSKIGSLRVVDADALHGKVACQLCHDAHGKTPVAPPGQPVCARCHQFENFQIGQPAVKSALVPEGHRNCEGCHKPHAPLASALATCATCHEKKARAASGTTALKHDACTSCHLPHTWKAERSGCMQCHAKEATLLATRSPKQHDTCTTCHDVHGPPPTGAVCLKCHSDTKGRHVALAPEKHKDCTSCHNPHAPKPEDTRTSCANCHAQQVTQVMRDGPEGHSKNTCFGCHKPHENPMPPANICASCHAERAAVVASAGPPKHRVCLSCHEEHKFRITETAPVCAKCHGPMFPTASLGVATEKVPHQGDCKQCHALHGSPGVPKSACFQCHKDVAAEFHPPNEKHAVCRSCHQPHKPAALAVTACNGCHQDKALVATQWPVGSPHQKQCNGCHQPHDARNKVACTSCHVKEATSAIAGKHQCTQCHAPHQAPPKLGSPSTSPWWTRCNQCHANKVESVKQRGPTHASCQSCHKPHAFAVPTCTSCHAPVDMAKKGLHSVPQHAATCNACHDPHVKSQPTRAQCLKCHQDRVNHEPNAVACQACHMFR